MKENQFECPTSKGATEALLRHHKLVTSSVLVVAEQKAAARCKDRDWRKHATVQRCDVLKAIREVHDLPGAEFLICTLAQSIPVLARKLGEDWMEKDFDPDKFHDQMGVWSSGERYAGLFLLNVWNPGYAKSKGWHFNLFDAIGTLSSDNLLPMCEWMLNPEWP